MSVSEESLAKQVNGAIADGYMPYGSMVFGTIHGQAWFYQPMLRASFIVK